MSCSASDSICLPFNIKFSLNISFPQGTRGSAFYKALYHQMENLLLMLSLEFIVCLGHWLIYQQHRHNNIFPSCCKRIPGVKNDVVSMSQKYDKDVPT